MNRMPTILGTLALGVLAGLAPVANAYAVNTSTATGTFSDATDSPKPVNDTHPRGSVTFTQNDASITYKITVTGLTPNRAYVTVPYLDGGCVPTPGVTAYPSSPFTTDSTGAANASGTVNPAAIDPLGGSVFTVDKTRSISIREVLTGSQSAGPITTPNVPLVLTEACDANPQVNAAGVSDPSLPVPTPSTQG